MVKHYAHSANKAGDKHLLKDHLLSVNEMVKDFLKDFKIASEARLAGLIHDFGKYGDLFQDRLKGKEQGIDHWSLGAWLALYEFRSIAAALVEVVSQHLLKEVCEKIREEAEDASRL